ncbi:hypothetical protein ACH4E7_17475 [Kitasatospora sp. NPDC018058]|uniref:hypothetical protein n=1 Tax=Kitasatospora sp. NPDC018058 TaxID=3364025 RepID=UPI0037BEB42B
MNNLDFSAEPLFSWYVVALAFSGVSILVFGALPIAGLKVVLRIVSILAGLGLLGYAYYLAFVFEGGTYTLYYKIFVVPIAVIALLVKEIVDRGKATKRPQTPPVGMYDPNAQQAPFNPNAQQAPFNPNAQQAPSDPNAPQPRQPVPPQGAVPVPPVPVPPVPAQGAVPGSPYQPGVPAQPVADNPYAQPTQPQPPQHPAG